MDKKRKVYAPFSLTSEAGVAQTPVEGYIDVNQTIYPTVSTGTVNENGKWEGVKSSDSEFRQFQTDLLVADNAIITSNKSINMYGGFNKLNIAIKVSRAGNYTFELLLGGDANDRYLNLTPINTAGAPKSTIRTDSATNAFDSLLADQENLSDNNVWYVFQVNELNDYIIKLKITNQSGGNSNIETAIQRLI